MTSDVRVENAGTIFMVEPITKKAKQWVDDNVPTESWQWLGNAFSVDQHYIQNLVEGMRGDGLTVG